MSWHAIHLPVDITVVPIGLVVTVFGVVVGGPKVAWYGCNFMADEWKIKWKYDHMQMLPITLKI